MTVVLHLKGEYSVYTIVQQGGPDRWKYCYCLRESEHMVYSMIPPVTALLMVIAMKMLICG